MTALTELVCVKSSSLTTSLTSRGCLQALESELRGSQQQWMNAGTACTDRGRGNLRRDNESRQKPFTSPIPPLRTSTT
eukprot:6927632-Alexandrium_andersonii.AAC.1